MKKISAFLLTFVGAVFSFNSAFAASAEASWFDDSKTEFTLTSVDEIAGLAELVNAGTSTFAGKTITLTKDDEYDFSDIAWAGIGIYSESDNSKAFQGTFNGNGATLKGVTFANTTANTYRGFFNQLYGATVSNLTVEVKGFVDGTSNKFGGAAIAGFASDSTIADCVATGSFTATHNVGGIVVRIKNANILRCTNKAALASSYTKIGGIAALSQNSTTGCLIEGCVNEGAISCTDSGTDGVGGIIGWIGNRSDNGVSADEGQRVTIKDCENRGEITGTSTAVIGQIVGKPRSYWSIHGSNKGLTTTPAVGDGEMDGLSYGLVTDGVATYTATLEAGKSYLVTAPNAKPGITLAAGESISFDTSLATIDATSITAATELMTSEDGKKITYTAASATVGETPYASLQAAFAAAEAESTIKLLGNMQLTACVTIAADKNITLDLNGKAITVTKSGDRSLYAFDNQGKLTLTDSSEEKTGSITARGVKNNGTMVMNGGTIYTCDTNGGYGVWNYADFTMNGGAIMTTHWVGHFQSPSTPTCLRNEMRPRR